MAVTTLQTAEYRDSSVTNAKLAGSIALSKLTEGANLIHKDGSVAMIADLDFGNNQGVNVGTPSASTDAANKAYVDAVAAGLKWKPAVRAQATANVTLDSAQTVDGVSDLANGDRVACFSQTTTTQDGIYVVNTAGAWTRATDFANATDQASAAYFVQEGTANADKAFSITNNVGAAVVGTDNLAVTQFSSGTSYTAGNGISISANEISVDTSVVATHTKFINYETPSGTVNGSNAEFTLANTPISGSVQVYLNGVRQEVGSGNDYTLSGSTITFETAPATGAKVRVDYRRT